MNDKIKKIIIFICFFVIIIGVIFLIKPKNVKEVINFKDIDFNNYMKDEYIVTDYSEFYTIEEIIKTIIKDLNYAKFDEIYKITSKDFKIAFDKKVYDSKIKGYTDKNFKMNINDERFTTPVYPNLNNLLMLYRIRDNEYIAKVDSLVGTTNIGISLVDDKRYVITYLDL